MRFLAVGSADELRQSFEPGDSPVIPRKNIEQAGSDLQSIQLTGPDGPQIIPIPPTGDIALPPLDKVGLYQTTPPIPGYEQFAVNLLDANESNTLPRDQAPGDETAIVETATNRKTHVDLLVVSNRLRRSCRCWWWNGGSTPGGRTFDQSPFYPPSPSQGEGWGEGLNELEYRKTCDHASPLNPSPDPPPARGKRKLRRHVFAGSSSSWPSVNLARKSLRSSSSTSTPAADRWLTGVSGESPASAASAFLPTDAGNCGLASAPGRAARRAW